MNAALDRQLQLEQLDRRRRALVEPAVQQAADSALMAALRVQLAVRRSTDITECQEYRRLQEHASAAFSLRHKEAARKKEEVGRRRKSEATGIDDFASSDSDEEEQDEPTESTPPFFTLRLQMAIHCGWAIEGALGSVQKVTPCYMGPHLETLDLLQSLGTRYGCSVVASGDVSSLLSEGAASYTRLVDTLPSSVATASAIAAVGGGGSTSVMLPDEPFEAALRRLLPPLAVHAVEVWDWTTAAVAAAASAAGVAAGNSPSFAGGQRLQPLMPLAALSPAGSTQHDNNASLVFAALVKAGSSRAPAFSASGSGSGSGSGNGSGSRGVFGSGGPGSLGLRVRAASGSSSSSRGNGGVLALPSSGLGGGGGGAGGGAGGGGGGATMLSFASLASTGIVDADLFNRDRSVVPERNRRISVLGGEDIIEHRTQLVPYDASTFRNDAALLSLRLPYPPAWRSATKQAVRLYAEGDWKEAAALFEQAARALGAAPAGGIVSAASSSSSPSSLPLSPEVVSAVLALKDPPSAVLYDRICSSDCKPPKGWRGGAAGFGAAVTAAGLRA